MAEDINIQSPWTTSQIENERPNIKRTTSKLTGYIANSMNAGHNKTIFWKRVLPGEKHLAMRLKTNIKLLTPLSPAYQQLRLVLRTYFVPDSRIWENADKFYSQKGGSSEVKIETIPNLGGKLLPLMFNGTQGRVTQITNTTLWRDSFISSYIPRIGVGEYENELDFNLFNTMPAINVLPLRGRIAIYNEFERNREYMEEVQEFKGDTVSEAETYNYLPIFTNPGGKGMDFYQMRARRDNSYYTNYRTELQGFEANYPPDDMSSDMSLINWNKFEQLYRETKAEASNAQKRDVEVIKELYGTSKVLTEGRVQLISTKNIPLNYSSITQTSYNNNEQVRDEYRVMGTQGAYSYTDIDLVLYNGMDFIEGGTIHVIATVTADTVFENGIDRTLLNINKFDLYRPDLAVESNDVLYEIETNTNVGGTNEWESLQNKVIGFKRKYSELFKLPNVIGGDLTTRDWFDSESDTTTGQIINDFDSTSRVITNNTYQFFEENPNYYEDINGDFVLKEYYLDYSDLLVNKNQAVKNKITWNFQSQQGEAGKYGITIKGQNQIFFVGMVQCLADLPVDEAIKNDYAKWGEH